MKIFIPISLICLFFMASCADKATCPAFQSYYILDEDKRDNKFSYFGEDSLPKQKEGIVSKNMFGIIEKPNYFTVANITAPKNELKARNARMNTIEMEVIYPSDEEDSLNLEGVVPDSSQATNQYESNVSFDLPDYSDLFDSTATVQDTAKPKVEHHYNIDQIYYMELIGDEIAEGRQARRDSISSASEESAANQTPEEVQPKVKQPFFKRIFSKKKKKTADDPVTDEGTESPALPDDTEEEQPADQPKKEKKKKEKKGFNPFKKKDKDKEQTQEGEGN